MLGKRIHIAPELEYKRLDQYPDTQGAKAYLSRDQRVLFYSGLARCGEPRPPLGDPSRKNANDRRDVTVYECVRE